MGLGGLVGEDVGVGRDVAISLAVGDGCSAVVQLNARRNAARVADMGGSLLMVVESLWRA